jgi:hypothetical protein
LGLFEQVGRVEPVGAARGGVTAAAAVPGAIRHALDLSGWLDGAVLAAGHLRQGKAPSMAALLTGTALAELARPRRSKSLPRQFVLAATDEHVIAFKASSVVIGDGTQREDRVTIKPGECGRWPRAAVRALDLADGAKSKGATLELAGERLPVVCPNLDGDPNTDELLSVLGGLAAPRTRLPGAARSVDHLELVADARRGRPDVSLEGWAERRGLRFRVAAPQAGHLGITCPWSADLLFNVVRGRWPGGTDGILCHEVRLFDVDTPGFFHGGEVIGTRRESLATFLLDGFLPLPVGGGRSFFKVPYTCAGARVPHLGELTGLQVARVAERRMAVAPDIGTWHERELEGGEWIARVRKGSDERTVAAVLDGPVREVLTQPRPLGFEIRIEYGQASIARQDFLKRDVDLEAFVADAEVLTSAVRELCVPPDGGLLLGRPIPAPAWLARVRADRRGKHTLWPPGARLEKVVAIADERGMAVEDPRAFHAAFPGLNVPGEAFGVLHGRLPGTALTGRLLCCAERPMVLPDEARKLLTDPGGAVGCDVAVIPVDPGATPTAPEGETDGDLRVAVADGVLTAWRVRRTWQADGGSLDRLAADAASAVERRGLA